MFICSQNARWSYPHLTVKGLTGGPGVKNPPSDTVDVGMILVGELRSHRPGEKKKVLAIKQEYRSSIGPYSVFVSLILVPQKQYFPRSPLVCYDFMFSCPILH